MILDKISSSVVDVLASKILDVLKINRKEPQTVSVKLDPESFSLTILDDVTTDKDVFPDLTDPNAEFKNPLKRDIVVREFTIVPDDNFKTKGMIKIFANDVLLYKNEKFGNFKNIHSSNVKILQGKTIKRDSSIKILLRNDDNTTPVEIAFQITYGEEKL